MNGPIGWLNNSLKYQVTTHRRAASKCRKAHKIEPFNGYCQILAEAHEEAAKAFEARIVKVKP